MAEVVEEVVVDGDEEVSLSVLVACVFVVWCASVSTCEVSGRPCE